MGLNALFQLKGELNVCTLTEKTVLKNQNMNLLHFYFEFQD